jgi:small subunit ribosomal protein S16
MEPSLIEVDSARVQHWLSVGAQPTDPVRHLLTITGDWQKFKGLPGAEGTLKTAEPKADKKERYEALVKESLAAKDAKDTKAAARPARGGQQKKDQPKQDRPKQDQSKQDRPKQDQSKQDQPKQDQSKQAAQAEAKSGAGAEAPEGAPKTDAADGGNGA